MVSMENPCIFFLWLENQKTKTKVNVEIYRKKLKMLEDVAFMWKEKKAEDQVVVMSADWGSFKRSFSHKTYTRVQLGVSIWP